MRSVSRSVVNPGGVVPDRHNEVRRPAVWLILVLLLAWIGSPPAVAAPTDEEHEDAPAEATFGEELTITSTRLQDEPEPMRSVPASVTVLTRQRIESTGATTVQDLLSLQTGTVLYDQVGNGVQTTFDLRGFTTGSGTRVFVDGVPVNEARNNGLWLDVVPLGAIDRVEITRGSNAAQAGGGALGGIVNLWTRRGEGTGGRLRAAAGDYDTRELAAELWHGGDQWDVFVAGLTSETDGFRDNAGGELQHLGGRLGLKAGASGRLALSFADGATDFGAPGALTIRELEEDREQTPFNQADFVDRQLMVWALNYSGALSPAFSLSANAYLRDGESESLSTGRSAVLFGGFLASTDESVAGTTLQGSYDSALGEGTNRVSFGAEVLDGETDALGFFTPPADPGNVELAALGSDNRADRRNVALYLQDTWQPADAWTIVVGARWDEDEVGYQERVPIDTNSAATRFSEVSLRAGLTWAPGDRNAVWLGYGEGFLPPSAEQLFSFPLFGSNPDLVPEDSQAVELGWRRNWSLSNLDVSLFRQDTTNEIVFDPNSPLGLFGANVNAGETRRSGLEAALRARAGTDVALFANVTLTDAEFRSGPDRGRTVPLVPEERVAAGVDWALPKGFAARGDVLYVGDQVLSNDTANAVERLPSYTVVNARFSWSLTSAEAGGRGQGREGLTVFVEARNLFDERYATRGIRAFDVSTGVDATFLTPAPGRRIMGGLAWGF